MDNDYKKTFLRHLIAVATKSNIGKGINDTISAIKNAMGTYKNFAKEWDTLNGAASPTGPAGGALKLGGAPAMRPPQMPQMPPQTPPAAKPMGGMMGGAMGGAMGGMMGGAMAGGMGKPMGQMMPPKPNLMPPNRPQF